MDLEIDIENELAILWQKIYNSILQFIMDKGLTDTPIELQNCCIKSLLVTSDGTIYLTDHNGTKDFVENFEDIVLYEVYQSLQKNNAMEIDAI